MEASASVSRVAPARRGLAISERRLILAALDCGAVAAAFLIAFNLHTAPVRGALFEVPRIGLGVTVLAWLIGAQIAGAYDLRVTTSLRSTVRVVGTSLGFSLIELLIFFFFVPYRITRPTLLLWVPLAALLTLTGRVGYRRVFARGYMAGRVALVMSRKGLEAVWPEVGQQLRGLYRVVAVVDPDEPRVADRLSTLVVTRSVDQIVLGVRDDISRDLFRGLIACHDGGVAVRSVADIYEELTGRMLLDQLGHTWLMALPMRSETSRLYRLFKRSVDVAAALFALVLLALFLPFVALATLLIDRGPLFHSQRRVGQYGKEFRLFKLRTMRAVDGETTWTRTDDRRITPAGRVLRRLHLDELPQAWSILRGDMSLIGPRPEQPRYVEQLRQQIDFYNTRLTVRPGLTGWAQVNYGYGSGVQGARAKLSYDLYYIKRQAASLDALIMARTVLAILSLNGR
ncbi:MAG TPA: exopolysaccharide biosynthesis polyprenyl glycosylphosphotransferase [Solirubrobacteraceae bacterium]